MSKREEIIDQIVHVADKNYPDSEIFLFGSQARGDSTTKSDWDLLILLNRQTISFETETKLMDDYYDLELKTGEVISPLVYSKLDWVYRYSGSPLRMNILKEGIKIR